jgi:hypothetical protein
MVFIKKLVKYFFEDLSKIAKAAIFFNVKVVKNPKCIGFLEVF